MPACRVDLSTHAIGGLSKADFILAAKLDAIPVDYSPKCKHRNGALLGPVCSLSAIVGFSLPEIGTGHW